MITLIKEYSEVIRKTYLSNDLYEITTMNVYSNETDVLNKWNQLHASSIFKVKVHEKHLLN